MLSQVFFITNSSSLLVRIRGLAAGLSGNDPTLPSSDQLALEERRQHGGDFLLEGCRLDLELLEQALLDVGDVDAFSEQLPEAGCGGVQLHDGVGAGVDQHQLPLELLTDDIGVGEIVETRAIGHRDDSREGLGCSFDVPPVVGKFGDGGIARQAAVVADHHLVEVFQPGVSLEVVVVFEETDHQIGADTASGQ